MDALMLARWQFGVTTVYHFFFVPLTIGLVFLVALMETLYVRTGDETYKRMTKFWGKLFLINFAVGVATGIVQEFQFGLNWSDYSRFVGDVFGAPLAIEALLAFFLESTFLGIWIFGWDRLPKVLHAATIWLVALGSSLSAFWILVANSFMQQPVGYALRNDRAEMTDFFALVTNTNVWFQFPHVLLGAVLTGAFFVMGISAYRMVKGTDEEGMFRRSFKMAAVYGLIGAMLIMPVGHAQAQHVVGTQPMKMAAAEALWESEDPAALSLFTWGDVPNRRDVFAIKVPNLLSFLAFNTLDGEVKGIKDLEVEYAQLYGPGDYVPPVAFTYWSFRIMVGVGMAMLLLAGYAVFLAFRGRFARDVLVLKLMVPAIALPYMGNTSGWLLTELGRQPWIVFGLMKTEQAVSPNVSAGMVLFSLVGFTLIYGALMAANVYLLAKFATGEPGPAEEPVLAGAV
jgi:cytochrome bd ubiquinol oxidase subunit I